ADNCKHGIDYCGWNLLNRGNTYNQRIPNELRVKNQPDDFTHVNSSLFWCVGGVNGDIEFQVYCGDGSCKDGGTNKSDYC
ncbi:uncharacterized protein BDR25DRAFT_159970, partial [Lindgomyces ingoldianus]